jgi:PAS domain S-box-containing protein
MSASGPNGPAEHALVSPRAQQVLTAAALAALGGAIVLGATSGPGAVLTALAAGAAGASACRRWSSAAAGRALRAAVASVERERSLAVDAAAHHAAHWRAIVDTATEAIVTIDEQGVVESVNGAAQRLFGYAPDELLGQNVSLLMPEPFRGEHDGYLERYLRTGQRRIIGIGREVVARRKDGSEFPIDLSVGEGWSGGRRFFTAVIRDVSDRKDMQMKLAQSELLA